MTPRLKDALITIFKEQLYWDPGSEFGVGLPGGPPTTQAVIAATGSMLAVLAACAQNAEGVHLEFNHYKEARHRPSMGPEHERSRAILCHN